MKFSKSMVFYALVMSAFWMTGLALDDGMEEVMWAFALLAATMYGFSSARHMIRTREGYRVTLEENGTYTVLHNGDKIGWAADSSTAFSTLMEHQAKNEK